MTTTLMVAAFGRTLLTIAYVAVSLLIIGLVLLQKNRGAGLSGAFGGVGGHTAFGTKTGDFLTWVTVSLVAVFLLLSIVGNYVFEPVKAGATNPAQVIPPSPSTLPPVTPEKQGTATPVTPVPAPQTGDGSAVPVKSESAPPFSTTPPAAPATGGSDGN